MKDILFYRKSISPGTGLIFFFTGLLAGVLFVQTMDESGFAGIFSEYFLNQYALLHIDCRRLLRYVGSCRLGQYLFLTCAAALFAAPLTAGGILFFFGMTWGTLISVSTVRLGLKGVLICVAGVIPQIFFYLPAFGWVILWLFRRGTSRKRFFLLAVGGFFFLIFGIVTEVYLNPLILQQILRKM